MPPKDVPMPFRTALPWAGFVALLFLLNYMSRSTLTPLLVSIEKIWASGTRRRRASS